MLQPHGWTTETIFLDDGSDFSLMDRSVVEGQDLIKDLKGTKLQNPLDPEKEYYTYNEIIKTIRITNNFKVIREIQVPFKVVDYSKRLLLGRQ